MMEVTFQNMLELLKVVGAVIAAASLYLAYRQLRASVQWNRINATFTFLPESVFLERERAVATALETLEVDLYKQEEPLSKETVTKILNDSQVFREAKDFLNLFEDYAAAYKINAIDRDHSYVLSASRFIRYFRVFEPLIKAFRHQRGNELWWIEFEGLVIRDWQKRQKKEIADAAAAREGSRSVQSYGKSTPSWLKRWFS